MLTVMSHIINGNVVSLGAQRGTKVDTGAVRFETRPQTTSPRKYQRIDESLAGAVKASSWDDASSERARPGAASERCATECRLHTVTQEVSGDHPVKQKLRLRC